MLKSDNCKGYTSSISLLAEVSAKHPSKGSCDVPSLSVFSCQTQDMETPDSTTRAQLEAMARKAIDAKPGCRGDDPGITFAFSSTQVGTRNPEIPADELAGIGLTSNCHREGNDPNVATHRVEATCHHPYDFVDTETGRTWRDYSKTFRASLNSCDISDKAMPQVFEDVMRVAAHNANESGYPVDSYKKLTCNFSVLPTR